MGTQNKEEPTKVHPVVLQVSSIVSEMAGIQLGEKQYAMIENRLKSRILRLNIKSLEDYLHFLKNNLENESLALLSLMTTHHTFFFREFSHFEYLLNSALSSAIERARNRPDKTIYVWSAACSKGHEVYSLAMFLNYHLKLMAPEIQFSIWGTDVDPNSVKMAENGVYQNHELKQSPSIYVQDNWVAGTGNVVGFSKVKSHLRRRCHFKAVNLLNCNEFLQDKSFDFIFCRNVFIYFSSEQIEKITSLFIPHLSSGGRLFLGVSESLHGLVLPLQLCGPSTYGHKNENLSPHPASALKKDAPTGPLRLLCIDDSKTILALFKRIFTPESGFELTATASNGNEAIALLKQKKFDAITLDLHMPVLDGLGFLEKFRDRTIPILVVSSINREDSIIAKKALDLGAADYVEKPSLENLAKAGNEIRSKLSTLTRTTKKSNPPQSPVRELKKIKVLIVDDSSTIRALLTKICQGDPSFEVVGTAEKPSQVEEMILRNRPDVITLDIHMPEMNGVELLEKIQPRFKIPTVMISSVSKEEGPYVLRALEVGAVDYIQKPQMNQLAEASDEIRSRLKIAASAKMLREKLVKRAQIVKTNIDQSFLVVLGASTGGTEALKKVLEVLPSQIPPILIVQHIPPVFSAAFAQRLNSLLPFEVIEGADGDEVCPNRVIVAPGGKQMGIKEVGGKLRIVINDDPPMTRHKPSVDYLFKSVSQLKFPKIVGGILTGMGADGAQYLKILRDQGARTIAQNEETCVVYGMPREAVQRQAAEFILPLEDIADRILTLVEKRESIKNSA